MKKRTVIAVLATIMVFASTALSFAGSGFELKSSYPENGQKNTSIENLGVKLEFSKDVNAKATIKSNKNAIKLIDQDGKKVPVQILFSDDDGGLVVVAADVNSGYKVQNNAEYTAVIDKSFRSNDGDVLGSTVEITFKTYNQKLNNIVNVVMMVAMFGGIMVLSLKQQKDNEEEEEPAANAINPYKEAKRTGKSVEQVKAELAAQAEKEAKKRAKKKKKEEPVEKKIENCAELLNNVYHVHAPAPTNKQDRSADALRSMRHAAKVEAKAEKKASAAKTKKKK